MTASNENISEEKPLAREKYYLGALIVRVSLVSILTGTDRTMKSCRAESVGSTHWQTAGIGTPGTVGTVGTVGTPGIENSGYNGIVNTILTILT